ncbi:MAG: SMP-30/gluconolactonase/LRE family protein, partial [Thermocrispum sp.]
MEFRDAKLVPLTGEGPEDVVVDADGQVYTGLADGRILRVSRDGRAVQTVAELDGRVYGLELYGEDDLLVCGGSLGLLAVSLSDGKPRTLVGGPGAGLRACNNAAVAADGTIYFSDSSTQYDIPQWRRDLVHQTRTGRLLRRTPDGAVDELLGELHFANGVALAPDESFVTVNETGAYRVRRCWLGGEPA